MYPINTVPNSFHGLYIISLQFPAQIFNMVVNHSVIPIKLIFPQLFQQNFPGHNLALVVQKFPQYFKFPFRQRYRLTIDKGLIVI